MTSLWRAAWVTGEAGAALRWQVRQWAQAAWRGLGWTGAIGLVLVVMCVAALAFSTWQRDDLTRLRVRQTEAPVLPRRAEPVALSNTGQDRARLHAFLTGLPSHRDIPAAVQTLLTLADEHGVSLVKGDYQFQPDAAAGFARYRIALPVKGNSTQIRRFISAALSAQHSLGVESLQLRRDQPQTDQIEARLEWVLYTRLPPSLDAAAETAR
jgi:Tfp pilus assembly protein PilO